MMNNKQNETISNDTITPQALEALQFSKIPDEGYAIAPPNKTGFDYYSLQIFFLDGKLKRVVLYQANHGMFGNVVDLPITTVSQLKIQLELLGCNDE